MVLLMEHNLFHWNMPHPIMSAAGPLGSNINTIRKMFSAGAAAVVTKTITLRPDIRSGSYFNLDGFMLNNERYSPRNVDEWEVDLDKLRGSRVIANIFASKPAELAVLAKRMVNCGIEVLELCLSCPTGGEEPVCFNLEKLYIYCKTVRASVDVPILAKLLLQLSSKQNLDMVKTVKQAGLDGVCFSDTLPALYLVRNNKSFHFEFGGVSGAFLKPLVLKTLYDISSIDLTLVGIGGIHSLSDIKDYLRLGATAVQLCTYVLKTGEAGFSKLIKEYSKSFNNGGESV
jgi:dihydroorotate dehydrogenase